MPAMTVPNEDPDDVAILATSAGEAIRAFSANEQVAAVAARNTSTVAGSRGASVFAETAGDGPGVVAIAHGKGSGLVAIADADDGGGAAVFANVDGQGHAVHAKVSNADGAGYALYAEHTGDGDGKRAAFFDGNVVVTGDVSFPAGADCAESFPVGVAEIAEPGTLMTIGASAVLEVAREPYDPRVAGVVAGAGNLRPGIVMGSGLSGNGPARAIALVGRVWVKADAEYAPIHVGNLLTTSGTPGHAMRATDRERAFGAVIGKALAPLPSGQGLIPMLIALQ